jgi:hypothetical protein
VCIQADLARLAANRIGMEDLRLAIAAANRRLALMTAGISHADANDQICASQ